MALVRYGFETDFFGKRVEAWWDTDELDNPEYYYYHKAMRLTRNDVAYLILTKKLTAVEIESNNDYAWLAD